ncbi:LysR family transcriptional regulator [Nonomuraea recticatena]
MSDTHRSGSTMEYRAIEIFLTLAAELHFGRTAERLHLSQSRVSQTIRQMERRIGAPLFDRTSRRVSLTPIGQRLREDLEPAHRQIQNALARAEAAARGVTGVLEIGFEAPALADELGAALDEFRRHHPDCDVRIREAPFHDPLAPLRNSEIDLLVTLLPVDVPGLSVSPPVFTEPMVLAVAERHPLARQTTVTLEDLATDTVLASARPVAPYWHPRPTAWTTPGGETVQSGRPVSTFQELLVAVAAGAGVCPVGAHVSRYFARPGVTFIPFRDAPPARWGLVWRSAGRTAKASAFVTLAIRRRVTVRGVRPVGSPRASQPGAPQNRA